MAARLTAKQLQAMVLLSGLAIHCMLFGGSRSGKTFLHVRNIVLRALKAAGSRHVILRFRFNHVKSSIIFDTFPKVMSLCFPGVKYVLSKSDWYVKFENGSEIWFGGLDDKERTEKILGNEYVTIYLCECSQISWNSRNIIVTRLAQLVIQCVKGMEDSILQPRIFYDCNPPNKNHWTYLYFIKKIDPETRMPLRNLSECTSFQMNPKDNVENLVPGYLDTLGALGSRMRKRFLDGEFADGNPNALFRDEDIDKWRVLDVADVPEFVRVAVGVDPSGADDKEPGEESDNDAIGIVCAGLGTDGNVYILEDNTLTAGPKTWGSVVAQTFDRREANIVAGEVNYGGAMVKHVVQTARPNTPYMAVTASRGKHIRAEPVSALYEQGRVRHVGVFQDLEDELTGFSTAGYTGEGSPNRADAAIWAIAALFPQLISKAGKKNQPAQALPLPSANPMARINR